MTLGPIAFLSPWLLVGLLALPVIWWLTLIRMAAAALVILALAEPVLNPNSEKALSGSGPVVLVVDNGWAAAAQWSVRSEMIERLIAEAEGQNRPVLIAPTAHATKAVSL